MRYEALDHIGDAQVRVFGDTLETLFANAGYALFDTIADVQSVAERRRRAIDVSADDLEHLMHAWLSELLSLFATEQLLGSGFYVQSVTPCRVLAEVAGEILDLSRHVFYTEIKAVTFHQLRVKLTAQGWIAEIIFDI